MDKDTLRVTVDLDEKDLDLLLEAEKSPEGKALNTRRAIFTEGLRQYTALAAALRNGCTITMVGPDGQPHPLPAVIQDLISGIQPVRPMLSLDSTLIHPETITALCAWARTAHSDTALPLLYLSHAIELIHTVEIAAMRSGPIYADTLMDLTICAAQSDSLRSILRDLVTQISTTFSSFTAMLAANGHPPFDQEFCGRSFLLREYKNAVA